jgi:hypothetical protein
MFQLFTSHHQAEELKDFFYNRMLTYEMAISYVNTRL